MNKIKGLVGLLESIESNLKGYEEEFKDTHFSSYPKIDIDYLGGLMDQLLVAFENLEPEQLKDIKSFYLNESLENPYKKNKFLMIPRSKGLGRIINDLKDYIEPITEIIKQKNMALFDYLEKDVDFDVFEDDSLNSFFRHDISHLANDYMHLLLGLSSTQVDSVQNISNNKDFLMQILRNYNENPEDLFNAPILSYKMIHYLVTSNLDMPSFSEYFSVDEICRKSAQIVASRGFSKGFVLTEEYSSRHKNQIVLDCEPINAKGNPGCLFSIIYNLLKNSFKKTVNDSNETNTLFIQSYEGPYSTYIISVGDNMDPINLNLMKDKVRKKILSEGFNSIDFPKKILKKIYQWQESPYKVGNFYPGEITNFCYLARLSGSEMPLNSLNSGLGLYGLSNLLKNNGRILYGEDFNTGGPIFSVILPKNPSTNPFNGFLNNARTYFAQRRLYRLGCLKKQKVNAS